MQEASDSWPQTPSPVDEVPNTSWAAIPNVLGNSANDANGIIDQSSTDDNEDIGTVMSHAWDPFRCADWDAQEPDIMCITRINRDIFDIFKDPLPGIFISPDPDNITKIRALIIGPPGTPYEGGFFYFTIRCPPDYPIRPPRCRLMTTGNGSVRFNPNLYANGKVCLSILGTWSGPAWSPVQCLSSLLLSIQSLMSEYPYHNEPGYEKERRSGEGRAYNEVIQHETIRVAVCEMLDNRKSCPSELYQKIEQEFLKLYDFYVRVCTENASKDGQAMADPFHDRRGLFEYSSILKRLSKLKAELETRASNSERGHQLMDPRTRAILDKAAMLYSESPASENLGHNNTFDDIDCREDEEEDTDDDDQME